jgi:hypothetical protein
MSLNMLIPIWSQIIHDKNKFFEGGEIGQMYDVSGKISRGEMFSKYGLEILNSYLTKREAKEHLRKIKEKGIDALIVEDKGNYYVFFKNKKLYMVKEENDILNEDELINYANTLFFYDDDDNEGEMKTIEEALKYFKANKIEVETI